MAMCKRWLGVAMVAVGLAAGPTWADVWDVSTGDNDDSFSTDNTLVHGSVQVHDLGARPGPVADQDWYRIHLDPYTSFEVQIDGTTGDIANGHTMELYQSDGATLIKSAVDAGLGGYTLRLNWANTTASKVEYFVKVGNAQCGTACSSSDQYTIRARETTVMLARFNNSGTQATVLLSQNASGGPASGTYFYWSPSGTLLQTGSLANFPAKNLNVFPVSNFAALVGQAGHITVAHDAPYGTWNVKAVALEPATGFTFDTPGVIRP